MRRSRLVSLAAAVTASSIVSAAHAGTSYIWNGSGGTQSWTDNTQWNPNTGHPTGAVGNGDNANLNVGIGSNLNINLAAGTYYVNSLTLGSTSGAFTTDIGNGGTSTGVLTLDGGARLDVDNTPLSYKNYSDVISAGAAGSTNIISAPVQLDEVAFHTDNNINNQNKGGSVGNYPFASFGSLQGGTLGALNDYGYASVVFDENSTNNITLSGAISQTGTDVEAGIFNAMPSSDTLMIGGGGNSISTTGSTFTATNTTGQTISFSGTTGSTTVINDPIIDGNTSFHGQVLYGNVQPNKTTPYPNPTPTIILQAASTYTGITFLGASNLVLENSAPFGTVGTGTNNVPGGGLSGEIRVQNSNNEYGQDISAGIAGITIHNGIQLAGNTTFQGQNSITWDGYMYQTSKKELDNNIVAGQSLTINGNIYIDDTATGKAWNWDGTGLTIVNGNVYNGNSDTGGSGSSPLVKSGTGTLQLTSASSTYGGATTVNGGLLEFSVPGSYGTTTNGVGGANNASATITVATGGAVALDSNAGGTLGSTDSTFIGQLTKAAAGTSTGSLALTTKDAAQNIDFTGTVLGAANLSNAKTVGMSIGAAGSSPVTYTGTITPAAGGYRLGGGDAILEVTTTLTGTAATNLTVTNGGSVQLDTPSTYAGTTTLKGLWVFSNANKAAANDNTAPGGGYETTTLSVSHIADGSSGLGTSASTAGNLLIDGSTLRYTGSTNDSTTRLFTINPLGATLDASGTMPVNFTNSGTIVETDQAPVVVNYGGSNGGGGAPFPFNRATITFDTLTTDTSNIATGMIVTDNTSLLAPYGTVTVAGVDNVSLWFGTSSPTNPVEITSGSDTLTFTNQNRSLSLTGTGTGVLAPALTDSAHGKLSVNKTGAGTWTLSGANTYTGGTTVTAGTLVIAPTTVANTVALPNGAVTIGATGNLTLADNASASTPFVSSAADITNQLMKMTSLSITTGGVLDVRNNHFNVADPGGVPSDATFTTIYGYVQSGAITSTEGLAGYGVGLVDGNDSVSGSPVSANQIEVAYTLQGDANLDGKVDATDFGIFAPNFGATGFTLGWEGGDFNYSGKVDATNFGLFAPNFGQSDSGTAVSLPAADYAALDAFAAANGLSLTSVPEPASLGLLTLGAVGIMARRRRHK